MTGSAALLVDDDGPQFDGLKLAATNVWIGKIKVESTCFSYIPANTDALTTCAAAVLRRHRHAVHLLQERQHDRPLGRQRGRQASQRGPDPPRRVRRPGQRAAGQPRRHARLQGQRRADRAERLAHQARVRALPDPAAAADQGHVGVGILRTPTGTEHGRHRRLGAYTTRRPGPPGRCRSAATSSVFDKNVGNGSVTSAAYNGFDFAVASKVDLYGIASLDGQIGGWVDATQPFNLAGSVTACVGGGICAKVGRRLERGVAVCMTIVSTYAVAGPVVSGRTRSPWASTSDRSTSGRVRLPLGRVSPPLRQLVRLRAVQRRRAPSRRARGRRDVDDHNNDNDSVSLRIHGTHGPPKVVLRGPNGTTDLAAEQGAAQAKGRYMLVENPRTQRPTCC